MTGDFIGVESSYYIKEEHANCDIVVNTDRYLLSIWALPDMTTSFTLLDKNTQKVESCSFPRNGYFRFVQFWSLGIFQSLQYLGYLTLMTNL